MRKDDLKSRIKVALVCISSFVFMFIISIFGYLVIEYIKADHYIKKINSCEKIIKTIDSQSQITSFQQSSRFNVYEITTGVSDEGVTLDETKIVLFNDECKLIGIFSNDSYRLGGANAVNSIDFGPKVLILNYHVNPDNYILRRIKFDLKDTAYSFRETYTNVLCSDEINKCVMTNM